MREDTLQIILNSLGICEVFQFVWVIRKFTRLVFSYFLKTHTFFRAQTDLVAITRMLQRKYFRLLFWRKNSTMPVRMKFWPSKSLRFLNQCSWISKKSKLIYFQENSLYTKKMTCVTQDKYEKKHYGETRRRMDSVALEHGLKWLRMVPSDWCVKISDVLDLFGSFLFQNLITYDIYV